MNRQIRIVGISLLALLLASIARAQAPATAQAATGPTIEPKAAAVLHKMADFYKATKSASAKIDTQIKTTGGPGGPAGKVISPVDNPPPTSRANVPCHFGLYLRSGVWITMWTNVENGSDKKREAPG